MSISDEELRRVMNPPARCDECGALLDTRREYALGGELMRTARVCGRCGWVEREWPA